ncbi:unnamed protein product [Amoebophrya sp. A25]|nr:unnamed protein product [Amoebophrya sp. A25]|eukprot:GSA25T00014034001.1
MTMTNVLASAADRPPPGRVTFDRVRASAKFRRTTSLAIACASFAASLGGLSCCEAASSPQLHTEFRRARTDGAAYVDRRGHHELRDNNGGPGRVVDGTGMDLQLPIPPAHARAKEVSAFPPVNSSAMVAIPLPTRVHHSDDSKRTSHFLFRSAPGGSYSSSSSTSPSTTRDRINLLQNDEGDQDFLCTTKTSTQNQNEQVATCKNKEEEDSPSTTIAPNTPCTSWSRFSRCSSSMGFRTDSDNALLDQRESKGINKRKAEEEANLAIKISDELVEHEEAAEVQQDAPGVSAANPAGTRPMEASTLQHVDEDRVPLRFGGINMISEPSTRISNVQISEENLELDPSYFLGWRQLSKDTCFSASSNHTMHTYYNGTNDLALPLASNTETRPARQQPTLFESGTGSLGPRHFLASSQDQSLGDDVEEEVFRSRNNNLDEVVTDGGLEPHQVEVGTIKKMNLPSLLMNTTKDPGGQVRGLESERGLVLDEEPTPVAFMLPVFTAPASGEQQDKGLEDVPEQISAGDGVPEPCPSFDAEALVFATRGAHEVETHDSGQEKELKATTVTPQRLSTVCCLQTSPEAKNEQTVWRLKTMPYLRQLLDKLSSDSREEFLATVPQRALHLTADVDMRRTLSNANDSSVSSGLPFIGGRRLSSSSSLVQYQRQDLRRSHEYKMPPDHHDGCNSALSRKLAASFSELQHEDPLLQHPPPHEEQEQRTGTGGIKINKQVDSEEGGDLQKKLLAPIPRVKIRLTAWDMKGGGFAGPVVDTSVDSDPYRDSGNPRIMSCPELESAECIMVGDPKTGEVLCYLDREAKWNAQPFLQESMLRSLLEKHETFLENNPNTFVGLVLENDLLLQLDDGIETADEHKKKDKEKKDGAKDDKGGKRKKDKQPKETNEKGDGGGTSASQQRATEEPLETYWSRMLGTFGYSAVNLEHEDGHEQHGGGAHTSKRLFPSGSRSEQVASPSTKSPQKIIPQLRDHHRPFAKVRRGGNGAGSSAEMEIFSRSVFRDLVSRGGTQMHSEIPSGRHLRFGKTMYAKLGSGLRNLGCEIRSNGVICSHGNSLFGFKDSGKDEN